MRNIHWIQGDNCCESPLFRRNFNLQALPVSAVLKICGLGYFLLYVNGKRVGDQEFMPAVTGYSSVLGCDTTYPVWEERTGYRCLYIVFDILPYLTAGENVIGIHLGNGWYHQTKRTDEGKFIYGFPKLRYECAMTDRDGAEIILESDPATLWSPSEVVSNNLFYGETQDLRLLQENWCTAGTSRSGWSWARPVHAPQTRLERQQCPADRVLRSIRPVCLRTNGHRKLYDCKENISGWVTLRCMGGEGEKITVRHSEELTRECGDLDVMSAGGEGQIQEDCYICNGRQVLVHPKFCWHGFRYFETEGPGEVESVSVVCTYVAVTSSFRCSDPVLNWLYDAYIRTQTSNYHNCVPSDCPHRERLGYTGDGQITCYAAMLLLDTKELYEKWYQDILDSQGADTGHIPHTAPFMGGGGGPGGWGCAVYVVPLNYYRVYGDTALLGKGYDTIIRWLEYMHSRCEDGLVVREEKGGWCLGEWCAPQAETEKLPEAFINTYFYIQGLQEIKRIAGLVDRQVPVWAEKRAELSAAALVHHYFDPNTDDFCGGTGAANAFALQLGLGSARTKDNLIVRYKCRRTLDTGMFGTPVLLQQLFSNGEAELAFALLTGDGPASFAAMMQSGATTLWERWEGTDSHNHPMFGSVVRLLFSEILGIRQNSNSCGYRDIEVRPADIAALTWAEGSIQTTEGMLHVAWNRSDGGRICVKQKRCWLLDREQ